MISKLDIKPCTYFIQFKIILNPTPQNISYFFKHLKFSFYDDL